MIALVINAYVANYCSSLGWGVEIAGPSLASGDDLAQSLQLVFDMPADRADALLEAAKAFPTRDMQLSGRQSLLQARLPPRAICAF